MNQAQHIVKGWSFQDILLEFYRYAPCPAEWLPKHCHDEYQFCLSIDCPGEYYYQGTYYSVPVSSLSVIHPGEMHTGRDIDDRQTPATFRMMYVSPALIEVAAADVAGRQTNLPFFTDPIILDPSLARLFLNFHRASEVMVSRLEQDSLLLTLLTQLIQRHADTTPALSLGRERESVSRVREYLQDYYGENVTLNRLAQIADLSPYHLSRVFLAEVGVSPHHYQTQVRIDRAKALLTRGTPIRQVAAETGFVDQSHLTRHFKRLAQVTPGKYRWQNRKNLQDTVDE